MLVRLRDSPYRAMWIYVQRLSPSSIAGISVTHVSTKRAIHITWLELAIREARCPTRMEQLAIRTSNCAETASTRFAQRRAVDRHLATSMACVVQVWTAMPNGLDSASQGENVPNVLR